MLLAPMPHSRFADTAPAKSAFDALFGWGLRIGDLVAVGAAGVIAHGVRFGTFHLSFGYQRHLAISVLIAALVFTLSPLYRRWRGRDLASELWTMLGAYTVMFGVAIVYTVALKFSSEVSRLWWVFWFLIAVSLGSCARVGARNVARWARRRGIYARTAIIVGSSRGASRVGEQLSLQAWSTTRLLGWFDTGGDRPPDAAPVATRLGELKNLGDYVKQVYVQQVWLALPMSAVAEISLALEQLKDSTAEVKLVPDLVGIQMLNQSVEQMGGLLVLNLRGSPLTADARLLKTIADRIFAAFVLVLISPLLAILAIGVKLSSEGPVLFRQKRHGLDGKEIEVWKFRSMRRHVEAGGAVTQATRDDPRVTRFGAFMRRTSLDELPQFFNVLQGTMSVVGPRPHAVEHNHRYKTLVQHYMQRHRIKPGITGWAQVNGLRGETDTLDKMAARVEYDLFYMQNWSPLFDVKIVVMTVVKGFAGRNAY